MFESHPTILLKIYRFLVRKTLIYDINSSGTIPHWNHIITKTEIVYVCAPSSAQTRVVNSATQEHKEMWSVFSKYLNISH